jgi:hypothetical protein
MIHANCVAVYPSDDLVIRRCQRSSAFCFTFNRRRVGRASYIPDLDRDAFVVARRFPYAVTWLRDHLRPCGSTSR